VLDQLRLRPLLDLGMRLGEGTGALLAVPLVQAAARVLTDTATLDDVLDRPAPASAGIGELARPDSEVQP
jgi:hypothetical protein